MLIDPGGWIARGRNLLDYPMPRADQNLETLCAGMDPARIAHFGRFLLQIGEAKLGGIFTEKKLRSLWEKTRSVAH